VSKKGSNIRLGWKLFSVTNTLAYIKAVLINIANLS
jgi:hypothetical protein